MTMSKGLSHIAMSVPAGTLTEEFRTELLDFYGGYLGWVEVEALRLPDRLTMAVGDADYVNIRERDESMVCLGYEHIGLLVDSTAAADDLWAQLDADDRDVHLEPLATGDDGYRSFRFRYLLPLALEVQYFPLGVREQYFA
jgi:catechol 2,3-dioxygenase-like lactoylglutathione lyase family enzyme